MLKGILNCIDESDVGDEFTSLGPWTMERESWLWMGDGIISDPNHRAIDKKNKRPMRSIHDLVWRPDHPGKKKYMSLPPNFNVESLVSKNTILDFLECWSQRYYFSWSNPQQRISAPQLQPLLQPSVNHGTCCLPSGRRSLRSLGIWRNGKFRNHWQFLSPF